jgi:hypothetical protein
LRRAELAGRDRSTITQEIIGSLIRVQQFPLGIKQKCGVRHMLDESLYLIDLKANLRRLSFH